MRTEHDHLVYYPPIQMTHRAYYHTNRLLTGLYKDETEVR
jgi:hypothetical protein